MNPRLWFYNLGIHIFPTHDKIPNVPKGTSQFSYRCTRAQAERFKEYGVPLGLLAVADSDDAPSEAWNAANLPPTPFIVSTARGRHRYYRLVGNLPHFFHRDGLTIEFRHAGQYVVGPDSVRPNGITYAADPWSWNVEELPFFPKDFLFNDGSCGTFSEAGEPYEFPKQVSAGRRHDELFRLLRSWKGSGIEYEQTRQVVHLANQHRCIPSLNENAEFEKWFMRQWNKPDRPFKEIPEAPLEPTSAPSIDLDAPGDDI